MGCKARWARSGCSHHLPPLCCATIAPEIGTADQIIFLLPGWRLGLLWISFLWYLWLQRASPLSLSSGAVPSAAFQGGNAVVWVIISVVVPCNIISCLWMTCSLFLSRKIPVGELGCPSDTSAPCYSPSQALPQLEIVYQISTFCWTQPGLLFNPPALTSATLWGKKKKDCHYSLALWDILTWHFEMY